MAKSRSLWLHTLGEVEITITGCGAPVINGAEHHRMRGCGRGKVGAEMVPRGGIDKRLLKSVLIPGSPSNGQVGHQSHTRRIAAIGR